MEILFPLFLNVFGLKKKNFILRLDENLYDALSRWAADDFRSINGQMEWILHTALKQNKRLPKAQQKNSPDQEADAPSE
ncbi:Arc family DNA binding domain-containing protein [Pedobacter sp. MW01-1-1]|uniref:Arc family DNA binding domain-containing protein n=1 Tax=Pedobacter sp. MW01-1-1 TaxID=3383027 RepID=UPI003FF1141C